MRLIIATAGLVGALLMLTGCDVTPGSKCSQQGSKATNSNGYTYTCAPIEGGKLIWQQDAPLKKDRP